MVKTWDAPIMHDLAYKSPSWQLIEAGNVQKSRISGLITKVPHQMHTYIKGPLVCYVVQFFLSGPNCWGKKWQLFDRTNCVTTKTYEFLHNLNIFAAGGGVGAAHVCADSFRCYVSTSFIIFPNSMGELYYFIHK